MRLEELAQRAPRYRAVFPEGWDGCAEVGVFCRWSHVRAAARFFRARHNVRVSIFVLPDDYWWHRYRLKNLIRFVLQGILGIRVRRLDEIRPSDPMALVMFGEPGFDVWQSIHLAQRGFRKVLFARDPAYAENPRACESKMHDPAFYQRYEKALAELYEGLQDEESRLTLASIVRHRETGDVGYLRLAEYRQYDHPVVRAHSGDVVLDVGAEDGGTSILFAGQVGMQGRVFAFEPDPVNEKALRLLFRSRPTIILVPLALGDRVDEVRWVSDAGGLSHVARPGEEGGTSVAVTSVDHFVREQKLARVDLIKMDTEGYEVPILRGAAETLRTFKPKLQVSVYHPQEGRDDLVDIPQLIRRIQPAYRFYLGHHGSWGNETILYATCVD